jgi:hypothetical protein
MAKRFWVGGSVGRSATRPLDTHDDDDDDDMDDVDEDVESKGRDNIL